MTLHDDMEAALSAVPAAMGEAWEFAKRTSDRDAAATFGTFNSISVMPLDHLKEHDEVTGGDQVSETIMVRVSVSDNLEIGDQMRDPDTNLWHVDDQVSSGVGTKRFILRRVARDLIGGLREGGL